MKELDIKLGYSCNNNCLFCLNKEKRFFDFSTEDLKKQILLSSCGGCAKIIISGGEPLIHTNFFEILNFAKSQKINYCEIQTNGRMLFYEEVVRSIKEIYPNAGFLISFHYPTPEIYQKYSQADGFYQVLEGIKNLDKYKLNYTINIVVFKGNMEFLMETVDVLKKYNVHSIQFRFIDGKNVSEDFDKFVPRMKDSVLKIKEVIKKNPNIKIVTNEIPLCLMGLEFIGNDSPKIYKERENLTFGNKVMNSQEIMKQQFVFPNCEKCLFRNDCKGIRKEYVNFYGKEEFNPIKNYVK